MSNPNETKFIPCDVETVITAEISIIDKDYALRSDFPFEQYVEFLKDKIKSEFRGDTRLKDDDIKVQFFIHEKESQK